MLLSVRPPVGSNHKFDPHENSSISTDCLLGSLPVAEICLWSWNVSYSSDVGRWTLNVVLLVIEYATWSFAANKYYDGLRYLSNYYSALQPVWRQNGANLFCILRSRSIQVNLVIWRTKSVSRMQVLWIKYKFVDCHYQPLTTWAQSVQKQSFFIILSCTLKKPCHRLMHLHRHLFRYRERSILIMRVLVIIDHSRLHKVVSFAMRLRIEPLVTELDTSLSY